MTDIFFLKHLEKNQWCWSTKKLLPVAKPSAVAIAAFSALILRDLKQEKDYKVTADGLQEKIILIVIISQLFLQSHANHTTQTVNLPYDRI